MKKIAVILFLLCLLYNSCKKQDIVTIDVDPIISRSVTLDDIYENPVFIQLETREDALIYEVTGLEIFNNRIYIHDVMNFGFLFCFDMQGKLLYKIANHGRGAGELMASFALDRENKFLWVADDYLDITKYDLDGNFIDKYKVEFSVRDVSVVPKTDDILVFGVGYHKGKDYGAAIYDMKNDTYITHRYYISELERQVRQKSFSSFQDQVVYGFGYTDTIFTVDSLAFKPRYALNFGKYKISDRMLFDPNTDKIRKEVRDPSKNYVGEVSRVIETDDYVKFIYPFRGKHMLALYSKSKKKLVNLSQVLIDGKEQELMNIYDAFGDNQFYSALYSQHISDSREGTLEHQQAPRYGVYKDINQLKSVIRKNDNPVIVVGKGHIDALFEKIDPD